MKDSLKGVKDFLSYVVRTSFLYLLIGVVVAGVYYTITSNGAEARDEMLNKPYENMISATTKAKSDDNVITTIEFIDTGKDVRISTGAGDIEKNKLWDVSYDKDTKLVYLYNPQQDTYIPYMKDKTTQYMWNINEEKLE